LQAAGIGAEAAAGFRLRGANVVLMAFGSQDAIADLAGEIGKQAIANPLNVAVSARCPRLWKPRLGPFGSVVMC